MKFTKKIAQMLIISFFGIGLCLSDCCGMESNPDGAGAEVDDDFSIDFNGGELVVNNFDTEDAGLLCFVESISCAAQQVITKLTFINCKRLKGNFDITSLSSLIEFGLVRCGQVKFIPKLPIKLKKLDVSGCSILPFDNRANWVLPDSLRAIKLPDGVVLVKEVLMNSLPEGGFEVASVRWKPGADWLWDKAYLLA